MIWLPTELAALVFWLRAVILERKIALEASGIGEYRFDMAQMSYVHGASEAPFVGDTIGVHFDRIVERFAERDALIVRHQ